MKFREILHLSIPSYPISVARVIDASLREHPVAIAPGVSERTLVHSLSSEAIKEGLFTGMSVRQARRLCPSLIILPPDPSLINRANRALQKVVATYSPLIETATNGRLFLDLTGCQSLLGPGRDVAMRLEKEIENRLRLTGTLGVAGNKLVSKIASGCLERPGVCDVLRGAESSFIAPLPVNVLPGIGKVREKILLQELNLRKIHELAALTLIQLRLIFGPFAPLVQQRAIGEDFSPVTPPKRTPEVSAESVLDREENDQNLLLAELCRIVESCGFKLRQRQRGTAEIDLSIHYADGVHQSQSLNLPVPQNHDLQLYSATEELFQALCTRRTRIKAFKLTCHKLGCPDQQVDLFTNCGPTPHQHSLQQTIDCIRSKYGMQGIKRGHTLTV
jgi:DNA polymerase IV